MNRILFETHEICDGFATFGGERAVHVLDVLHGEVGQVLKTGEIDGRIGTSTIVAIRGRTDAENGSSTGEGGARQGTCSTVGAGPVVTVRVCHEAESLPPWVDLILAPPRPRVMKRLLPQLATLGVGRIFLVGAQKVEKDFWGATLLKPENYRPLLIDGLMQGGTSILPTIETRRNFRRFLNEELDALFPTARRIVAHPYASPSGDEPAAPAQPDSRLLLAIGPEGGWTDDEVARLEAKGFARYSLGQRILRTDTATIALLAKLNTEDK